MSGASSLMRRLLLFIVLFVAVGALCNAAWLSGYTYRKQITIQGDNLTGSLSHFPLLIKFSGDTDVSSNAQADGDDIRFTQSDGSTELDRHKIYYSAGTGIFRVSDSGWSITGGTVLYMYYGNGSATDPGTEAGVYDANYKAVWMMHDASGTITDTLGTHDSDAESLNAYQQTGKIHYAVDFEEASSHYIQIADHADFTVTEFTIECWINMEEYGFLDYFFQKFDGVTDDGFYARAITNGSDVIDFNVEVADTGRTIGTNVNELTVGNWYHIAFTRDASGNMRAYVNGVEQTDTDTNAGEIDSTDPLYIGRDRGGSVGRYYDGLMEDARFSNTNRNTGEWLSFQYANANESDHEISIGSQQTEEPGPDPSYTPRVIIIKGIFSGGILSK